MSDIKRQVADVVETTNDPMAAIKLHEAYSAVNAIGKMLAGISSRETVIAYNETLLSHWPGEKVEEVCYTSEFVIALGGLFCESLKGWKDRAKIVPTRYASGA